MKRQPARLILSAAAAALLFACRRDDITVQRVPKEPPLAMPGAPGAPAGPAQSDAAWTAPPGWKEIAPSQMRVASYSVATAGEPIDISIVPLAGAAGGDLANINRWRGQLSLPALSETGLSSVARRQKLGAHDALVVEFAATDAPPRRLLAAIISHDGVSWFFKATGPDADVARLKPAFLAFAASLRFRHQHHD